MTEAAAVRASASVTGAMAGTAETAHRASVVMVNMRRGHHVASSAMKQTAKQRRTDDSACDRRRSPCRV